MKKVLFIGAHYDDIELGCLGTILKFKKEGYDVRIVVATHSGYSDSLKGHVRKRKDAYQESKVIEDYYKFLLLGWIMILWLLQLITESLKS